MRRLSLGLVAVCLVVLVLAETAQAQISFGRGGRGGTSVGVSTPGFGFGYRSGGWGGSGWNVRIGEPYYGYGYPGYGYYGRPYYGGGWYSGYPTYYSYPSYGYYSYPSYGYYSRGWSNPGITYSSSTWDPSYAAGPQPAGYQASYQEPQGQNQNQVLLRVHVPNPNARVWVEGQQTRQMGTDRLFVSPPLEAGTYHYTVRATWMESGREVSREQKVKVEVGREAHVSFMTGQGDGGIRRAGFEEPGRDRTSEEQFRDPSRPRDDRDRNRETPENRNQDANRQAPGQEEQEPALIGPFRARVVRVEEGQLVATGHTGEETTYRIPAGTRIMLDGKQSELSLLKPGMQLTITTEADRPTMVTQVEATSPTEPNR